MLGWALTFLVVSLLAAAIGFGGLVGITASIAQILFGVFMFMFVATVIFRKSNGKPPV